VQAQLGSVEAAKFTLKFSHPENECFEPDLKTYELQLGPLKGRSTLVKVPLQISVRFLERNKVLFDIVREVNNPKN